MSPRIGRSLCLTCLAVLTGVFGIVVNTAAEKPALDPAFSTRSYAINVSRHSAKLYNEGTDRLKSGKYKEAIPYLVDAVKESPGNVDALDHLGICLRRIGQYADAVKVYDLSIRTNPKNPIPYGNLGLIYLTHLKDYQRAALLYGKVIEIDPKNPEGWYGAGEVDFNKQEYGTAIDYYLKAAELYRLMKSPVIRDAYFKLGVCYVQKLPADDHSAALYFLRAKQAGLELPEKVESFTRKILQSR